MRKVFRALGEASFKAVGLERGLAVEPARWGVFLVAASPSSRQQQEKR